MPVRTPTPATRRRAPSAEQPATARPETVILDPSLYGTGARPALIGDTCTDRQGRTLLRSDTISIESVIYYVHDELLSECQRCESRGLTSMFSQVLHRPARGSSAVMWCPSCAASNTWQCSSCENGVSESVRMQYNTDDRDHEHALCPNCVPREEDSIYGKLLNYSNRAISGVAAEDGSGILFGLEVETHVRNNKNPEEAIRELYRILGKGYYVTKSDSSIVNGFEIVTRPDSMRVHRAEWLKIFEAINSSEYLKEHLRSWSAPRQCCGLHCHVDKASLSQMQLGKLNVFLNHKNNRAFIEKIAGRGSNSYTSFRDDVKVTDGRTLKTGTSPERYVALNVGHNTAEMRLFRGTLNPESFFRVLDFIEASVEWTGLSNCSARHVSDVSCFSAFVHAEKHRFPFLLTKLIEWGIEPAKSK